MAWNPFSRKTPSPEKASALSATLAATRLFDDPIVIYIKKWSLVSGGAGSNILRVSPLVSMLADQEVVWLVTVPWTAEASSAQKSYTRTQNAVKQIAPKHRLIFVANTHAEYLVFKRCGLEALLANQNQFIDPAVFKPFDNSNDRPFDAVYNARFVPFKRHELAVEVPRLSLIGYEFGTPQFEAIATLLPEAHFANDQGGAFRKLTYSEVNEALNLARVGLCLSGVEGAMTAGAEYLLAGLPVVTTPSRGGRDAFFDVRFVHWVPPNAAEVAHAVKSLVDEDISPEFIRSETLKKMTAANQKFLDDLSKILAIPRADLARAFSERFNHRLATRKRCETFLESPR